MIGFNGGLIGKDRNTTTAASVPGVWTLGEQVKAKRSLLWPIVSDDPNFADVSLLLRGNGTNGSTTFSDDSANNFTITRSGSAQISTTQSKFGGASIYCPTSAYLAGPSNAKFQFETGNFTIEFWVYLIGSGSLFSSELNSLASTTLNCRLYSSGTLDVYASGGAEYLSISSTVSSSTWTHLAFSKSGTTMRVFKDGNLIGSSASWSNNLTSTQFYLNGGRDGNGEKYYDDLRITKGVARYTSNFTPPDAL